VRRMSEGCRKRLLLGLNTSVAGLHRLRVLTVLGISAHSGNLPTVLDCRPNLRMHVYCLSLCVTGVSPAGIIPALGGMIPAVGRGELLTRIHRGGALGII
jgi:hypothetical protein